MASRKTCIYCGGPVDADGYCRDCRLNQKFLMKAGNTSLFYYNIGLDRARNSDLTGAEEALKMSLRYNKTNIEARNLLGLVMYEKGEAVDAIRQWVMSINYRPKDNPAARYLKELREKPKDLEKLNDAARTFNLALDHAGRREFDLAVIQLRKCLTLNRHFQKAYLLMALISMEQKRNGAARRYISHVLAEDKNNPTARHYLMEMGESEEGMRRLAEHGKEESSEELFQYYGMETRPGERPAQKISVKWKEGRRKNQTTNRREQNLARFSNIYMLAGILIGALAFYYLFMPALRQKEETKLQKTETAYNESLSVRNSEIESLNRTVDTVNQKNRELSSQTDALQKTVEDLNQEVETLKKDAAAAGDAASLQNQSGPSQDDPAGDGQAGETAATDSSGVTGVDRSDLETLIQNE